MIIGTRTNNPNKLANVDLDGLLHHTIIVGQSGSGKSFLVARLLEEIVVETRARVVVIDPNGDFRNIHRVSPHIFNSLAGRFAELSSNPTGASSYETESAFREVWEKRRFLHLNPNRSRLPPDEDMVLHRNLVIHWDSLDEDDRSFLLRSEAQMNARILLGLEACAASAEHFADKWNSWLGNDLRGLINAAEQFAERNLSLRFHEYAKNLQPDDWYAVRATLVELLARYKIWWSMSKANPVRPAGLSDFLAGPFLGASPESEKWWDVLTITLDASRQSDALLVVNTTLSRLWSVAKSAWRRAGREGVEDTRVPTFVVIDEAQNFAPASASSSLRTRVTEQLIRIASEGRKYGIYLILATQRPTKLHPELVPECENSCVLRVQSRLDTAFASSALGLEERNAAMAPSFAKGQGLISGRWIDSEVEIDVRFAPARTVVGGGGLPETWKVRKTASSAVEADSVGSIIESELRTWQEPVPLVELAKFVRAECPEVDDRDWNGYETFKAFLQSLEIRALRFGENPPGYAYLDGVHNPPPETTEPTVQAPPLSAQDRLREAPDNLRMALLELHREAGVPVLERQAFGSIFRALSEILGEGSFNLTETSKATRDLLLDKGLSVGRGAVSYIIKGISMSGHRFDSDLPQDPKTLASAFARQLAGNFRVLATTDRESTLHAIAYCTGGLVSVGEIVGERVSTLDERATDENDG